MISISELSAIAESRRLRGHRWERPAHRVSNRKGGQPLVVQSNGRTRSRSATSREERENGPVLNSPWLRGWCEVVGNDVVMFQVNQQRLHDEKHYESNVRWMKLWKPVKCLTLELGDLVAMMMLKKNLVKQNLGVAIVGSGQWEDVKTT